MEKKSTKAFVVGVAFVALIFILATYASAQQPVKLEDDRLHALRPPYRWPRRLPSSGRRR